MSFLKPLSAVRHGALNGLLAIGVYLGASAQATTAGDYVTVQEDRLRSGLAVLASERTKVRSEFAARELACLNRFVSAPCLEDVRQGYARALRDLDLVEEMLNTEIRQLHSAARLRARQQTIARHVQSLEEGRAKQ